MQPAAPDSDALRTSALASILPAAALGMLAAAAIAEVAGLGAAFAWRALAILAAGATVLVLGLESHRPQPRFGAANQLTLIRATIVALLLAMIGEARVPVALAFGIALVAASLDAADGRVARSQGLSSRYGARFDMETDALLILALSVLLWRAGILGPWVIVGGALRHAYVLAGRVLPRLRTPLSPSRRRQALAVVQVVSLLVALAPFTPATVANAVAAAGLAGLLVSFGIDVGAAWRSGAATA